MLPLLTFSADGKEHSIAEAVEELSTVFKLTPEERSTLLPSGRQAVFHNRVSWAVSYFRAAGLLRRTGRGRFTIAERGREILARKPNRIDIRLLSQFPEFVEFHSPRKEAPTPASGGVSPEGEELDPEEKIEAIYQELRRSLAKELIERIQQCSPTFFERLVVDLLVAMGYGGSRKDAGKAIGRSGDDGIDGIIKEDKLGLDAILVQAKRWGNTVGRPVVQAFAGSLEGQRAKKGILITTSQFSQDARDYVNRIEKKIVLIDGSQLADYMIDHGIGVTMRIPTQSGH